MVGKTNRRKSRRRKMGLSVFTYMPMCVVFSVLLIVNFSSEMKVIDEQFATTFESDSKSATDLPSF